MGGHYFVSYSRADGRSVALRLVDRLAGHRLWVDVRDVRPGRDWDDQIRDAIQDCRALLLVVTADAVQDRSTCKSEWTWALRCKKPVIPVRVDPDAELPFRIASRQALDLTDDVDAGADCLAEHLRWLDSPEGVLQDLLLRLGDAERELPRTADARRDLVEQDIRELTARVAAQRALVADPQAAAARVAERIGTALEAQRAPARTASVNPAPVVAPGYFQGREAETALLAAALRADDIRLAVVVGRGGIGKTALACRLLAGLRAGKPPDGLPRLALHGVVHLSSPGVHPISFPNLFADLCRLLPAADADRLHRRSREGAESPTSLVHALLDVSSPGRRVVLLDNFEDLVDPAGAITDRALDEALRALLSAPAHRVTIVITTRTAPRELLLHPGGVRRIDLDSGLTAPQAARLLRARDPDGRLGLRRAPGELLTVAAERTRGYPRALEALAALLSADRDTTFAELLDETRRLPDNVVEALVGEAFGRLDPAARQIVQALAVLGRPAPAVAVDYVLQPFQPAVDAGPALGRLVGMGFVRRTGRRYDLHQVDRDHAIDRLREDAPDGPPSLTARALRERAADYFREVRTPRASWRGIADLEPQLAEFDLRHRLGEFDEAAAILLDIGFDHLALWGHYRTLLELHELVHPGITNSWIRSASLREAARCHRIVGRPRTAIELHEQALSIDRGTGDRIGEANALSNLGMCHADLGRTGQAIELFSRSLAINRETGSRGGEAANLAHLGDCYLELGHVPRAITLYSQSRAVHHELGNPRGEAACATSLGICHAELGDTARAVELNTGSLDINRELGNRHGEAANLSNLSDCHADLGAVDRAIDLQSRSLRIERDIGHRSGEVVSLTALGECHAQIGQWPAALELLEQAAGIADAHEFAAATARIALVAARTRLWAGDPASAASVLATPHGRPTRADRARIALLTGIAAARREQIDAAVEAFTEAVARAEEILEPSPGTVDVLDIKALAHTALALVGPTAGTTGAITAFRAARARSAADGVVRRVLRDLDTLAPLDRAGLLGTVRPAAAGR